MTLLYVDTNIYLDFYQSAHDRLSLFDELQLVSESVIITEQTGYEFIRNRTARLTQLAKEVEKTLSHQVHTTAIIRDTEEYTEIIKIQERRKELASAISRKLKSWRDQANTDPVFTGFNNLYASAIKYRTTEEAINKALRRKQLGNPPTSPDKHTIGDELIWETLTDRCDDDLIIASRDHTFLDNQSLLQVEFKVKSKNRKELTAITNSVSEALRLLGKPSKRVELAEQQIKESEDHNLDSIGSQCSRCGGEIQQIGYEGGDGEEAHWSACKKCGLEIFPKSAA